jgi:hypothetical protein
MTVNIAHRGIVGISSRSLKRGEPVVVAVQVSGPDQSENLSPVEKSAVFGVCQIQ